MKWIAILTLALIGIAASGATYYVRTDGNNSNNGLANTSGGAWLTLAYAATHYSSGDTVRVQSGTYDEQPTISVGATTSSSMVNWVADGSPVCRGFVVGNVSNVRIIGFEITHNSTTFNDGIVFASFGNTLTNIQVIDNYIHNIKATHGAIVVASGSSPIWLDHITLRGNRIEDVGIVPGVTTNSPTVGAASANTTGWASSWLVEYNAMARVGDYCNIFGTNNIIRNNYLHDYQDIYWGASSSFHSDCFQPGSDHLNTGTHNHIYENNFCGDCIELNSHGGIWQDVPTSYPNPPHGDTNIVLRGNVMFNFGSGAFGIITIPHVVAYNDTLYKTCQAAVGAVVIWYKGGSLSTNYVTGALGQNLLIDDYGLSSGALNIETLSTGVLSNNIGYIAGTDSSYISTSDPLFVDPSSHNFRLQSGSPAKSTGKNVIWVTSSNGSGTAFDINDGQLLTDGRGTVDGDTITVGGVTTTVTNISGNTLSVVASVTWTNLTPVYWGPYSTADVGALPYGSTELTAAVIAQSGNTYTVTPTGNARGVWFYVDGIPTTWVSALPYSATIASGTVTAKAYALYAQAVPTISASTVTNSGTIHSISGNSAIRGNVVIR